MTERPDHGLAISLSPGEVRVALIEQGRLSVFWRDDNRSACRIGDVFRGRITAIDAKLGGAFVDIGQGETGFIDVPAQPSLSKGSSLLVQVANDAEDGKQLGLRRRIELAGHALTLIPGGAGVEVSRRIADAQARAALKTLIGGLARPGEGWVVRTVAVGTPPARLKAEAETLRRQAAQLSADGQPGLVRAEPDLMLRALRDLASPEMAEIVIDDGAAFSRARNFVATEQPDLADRLQVYRGPGLFEAWGIDAELEAVLERRHPLPGGGVLSIDPTPTLTAIDVDRAGSPQSLRSINLEAAERLAELIPLRNIGGLVVIDFLRMATSQDRAIVAQRLTAALKDDPLRAQVLGFTRAGLCEVTRPRSGRSLERALQAPCVVCAGTGHVGDARVRGLEAIRAIIAASAANPTMALMIAAAPAIARMLMGSLAASLDEAERLIGRAIPIVPEPNLMPDRFEIGPDMDML